MVGSASARLLLATEMWWMMAGGTLSNTHTHTCAYVREIVSHVAAYFENVDMLNGKMSLDAVVVFLPSPLL